MKYVLVMALILSSVVYAKVNSQDEKMIQEAGESLGSNMSFSREITIENIERTCLSNIKRVALTVEKTEEIETIAAAYCVSQWKSLQ